MSNITISQDQLKYIMRECFRAGWEESAEGWNHEHGPRDKKLEDEVFDKIEKIIEATINELNESN